LKEGEKLHHGLVNNKPFIISGNDFSHVAVSKHDNDRAPLIYVCGSEKDKNIRELTLEGEGQAVELRSNMKYEDSVQLSKIAFTADRRFFFAGRIDSGMPGSVQVLAYPFEKVYEIQAHAQAVERLRLSYDNSTLFTCGLDGTVGCFSVLDHNGKKYDSGQPIVPTSQENLLLQTDLLKKKAHIERLKASINQEHKNKMLELEQQKRKKQLQIDDQREAMRAKKAESDGRLLELEVQ
jgi:WD40 repeat protein